MSSASQAEVIVLADHRFDPTKEHITCVAILIKDGPEAGLYVARRPKRHGDLIREMIEEMECTAPVIGEQGFLTSTSRFVDRKDGLIIAKACGQLRRPKGPQHYQGDELFSEDIW